MPRHTIVNRAVCRGVDDRSRHRAARLDPCRAKKRCFVSRRFVCASRTPGNLCRYDNYTVMYCYQRNGVNLCYQSSPSHGTKSCGCTTVAKSESASYGAVSPSIDIDHFFILIVFCLFRRSLAGLPGLLRLLGLLR